MAKSQLAIIIPAWNEQNTISKVVKKTSEYGSVIVVDDCSDDKTAALAESEGGIIVKHTDNKGYDGALNSGFRKAFELGYQYAVTFDADGQHDYSLIARYLDLLKAGNDMVLGIRPKPARLGEFVFALVTGFRFGIKDPLCGMKGYRLSLFEKRGWFDSCNSIGTELAIWACRKKYRFVQIPIPIHSRGDKPRFGRTIKANIKLFKALYRVMSLKNM